MLNTSSRNAKQCLTEFSIFLSNNGSLQEKGYDLPIQDAHLPRKPLLMMGLDWSRDVENDLDIEIRISTEKKQSKRRYPETYELRWGNGDFLADLAYDKFYRYRGPLVHSTIIAKASNHFGAVDSDEHEVKDMLDAVHARTDEKGA